MTFQHRQTIPHLAPPVGPPYPSSSRIHQGQTASTLSRHDDPSDIRLEGAEGRYEYEPRRPTMATYSGLTESGSERDDTEELTTKGRKRKRLAKACSACHKNKRRCDGFSPCANCEFSSRPCFYLDAQGKQVPPPRLRGSSSSTPRHHESSREGEVASSSRFDSRMSLDPEWMGHRRKDQTGPLQVVDTDVTISSELIDIFFRRVMPFAAMFHIPTFYHRLYLNLVSPLLLDVIYALSARACENVTFLSAFPTDTPAADRGRWFAERAHGVARAQMAPRNMSMETYSSSALEAWENTELVQALLLLGIHDTYLNHGASSTAALYLDAAINISLELIHISNRDPYHFGLHASGTKAIEYSTMVEARSRTFRMLLAMDLFGVADRELKNQLAHELRNVSLPGPEVEWARRGGAERAVVIQGGIHVPATLRSQEDEIGELGHLLRVLSIFSEILLIIKGDTSAQKSDLAGQERALKAWETALPRHLQFDEMNLAAATSRLNSPLLATALSGWMSACMHAVAECAVMQVQAALADTGSSSTTFKQNQAARNLAVILEAMGEIGRESPLMLLPMAIILRRQHHYSSTSSHSGMLDSHLDERVSLWWAEMKRVWGLSRDHILQLGVGLFPSEPPLSDHLDISPLTHTRTRFLPDLPVSTLGLYHSPSRAGLERGFSASTSSSMITQSAPSGGYRLPPLVTRPRTASSMVSYPLLNSPASPSRPKRYHHQPAMSLSTIADLSSRELALPALSSTNHQSQTIPSSSSDRSYVHHWIEDERGGQSRIKRSPEWLTPNPGGGGQDDERRKTGPTEPRSGDASSSFKGGQMSKSASVGIAALISAADDAD